MLAHETAEKIPDKHAVYVYLYKDQLYHKPAYICRLIFYAYV